MQFIFVGFAVLVAWQCVYAIVIMGRMRTKKGMATFSLDGYLPPMSVVICARNEEANLRSFLPTVLEQEYPEFEVIVVNDASTDQTTDLLKLLQLKYPTLVIVNILTSDPRPFPGKKTALSRGIEKARYEWLALTDADCRPASSFWLRDMAAQIEEKTEIILGYSPYFTLQGNLNRFIRWETVFAAIHYFGFALFGIPYMGVGRNLVYKKELIERTGGFADISHVASGDDDLFINRVANKHNVAICLLPNSFIYSLPKTTTESFYRQKKRHLSTGIYYHVRHQILIGFWSSSLVIYHLCTPFVLLMNYMFWEVLILIIVRELVVNCINAYGLRRLQEQNLIPYLPILDRALALYYCIMIWTMLKRDSKRWS